MAKFTLSLINEFFCELVAWKMRCFFAVTPCGGGCVWGKPIGLNILSRPLSCDKRPSPRKGKGIIEA